MDDDAAAWKIWAMHERARADVYRARTAALNAQTAALNAHTAALRRQIARKEFEKKFEAFKANCQQALIDAYRAQTAALNARIEALERERARKEFEKKFKALKDNWGFAAAASSLATTWFVVSTIAVIVWALACSLAGEVYGAWSIAGSNFPPVMGTRRQTLTAIGHRPIDPMSDAQNQQEQPGNSNTNPTNGGDQQPGAMGSSSSTAAAADAQPPVPALPPPPPHTHVPPAPSAQLIECLCSDGVVVEVPVNYLRVSRLFNDMCRNLRLDEEENGAVEGNGGARFEGQFPVGPIRHEVMQKIADWCEKHCGLPDPVLEYTELFERKRFVYTDWEHAFLTALSVDELKEVLIATSFLDLYSLFIYACQRGAELMENKTPEQVRAEWGFPDDLSDEEKAQIRRDWNLPPA